MCFILQVTHECLDRHVLKMADTNMDRYPVTSSGYENNKFNIKVILPQGLKCRACVLQWKYNTGNSWGTDPGPNGESCIGCGNQEQFYGCADIAIGHDDVVLNHTPSPDKWSRPGVVVIGRSTTSKTTQIEDIGQNGVSDGQNMPNCNNESCQMTINHIVMVTLACMSRVAYLL